MPYISSRTELVEILNEIPFAETAKMAIVRPTTHFKIVTGDNPDMVRTMQKQNEFVKEGLEKLGDLTESEREIKTQELIMVFQRKLSDQAYVEQKGLIEKMTVHGIPTPVIVEDKGKLKSAAFDYYTDQIFATDTGQYYDNDGRLEFIAGNFKNQQRQGEERLAIAQAVDIGAEVKTLHSPGGDKLIFEGGDIRQMPGRKLFFMGQGKRSDPETGKEIAKASGYFVLPIELLQDQFYHLDCCFLPLPNDAALIYEGEYCKDNLGKNLLDERGWPIIKASTATMTEESRALIRTIYSLDKLVLINKDEALAFATNAAILQSPKDNRFKMFVNGDRPSILTDETKAITEQQISLTEQHIQEIIEVTNGIMDVIEVPYQTMHCSGGSVRCTVQEVACSMAALTPHKNNPSYFSEAIDTVQNQLSVGAKMALGLFSNKDTLVEPEDSRTQMLNIQKI